MRICTVRKLISGLVSTRIAREPNSSVEMVSPAWSTSGAMHTCTGGGWGMGIGGGKGGVGTVMEGGNEGGCTARTSDERRVAVVYGGGSGGGGRGGGGGGWARQERGAAVAREGRLEQACEGGVPVGDVLRSIRERLDAVAEHEQARVDVLRLHLAQPLALRKQCEGKTHTQARARERGGWWRAFRSSHTECMRCMRMARRLRQLRLRTQWVSIARLALLEALRPREVDESELPDRLLDGDEVLGVLMRRITRWRGWDGMG